jgi:hypothetical protein
MRRAPAPKARMRRRFVVAACADAATSGWQKTRLQHVITAVTVNMVRVAEWHNDTLSANTRISQFALPLCIWWLDPEFATSISLGPGCATALSTQAGTERRRSTEPSRWAQATQETVRFESSGGNSGHLRLHNRAAAIQGGHLGQTQ